MISTDLPILSSWETAATIYKKDKEHFHLILSHIPFANEENTNSDSLLWLEVSPSRVILTMQGLTNLNYRHFWEEGVYGVSRYWLQNQNHGEISSIRLRNYTRSLKLEGSPLLKKLRVDYELWSDKLQLGHYVLYLEIHN